MKTEEQIEEAMSLPLAWQMLEGDNWRSLVHRYPYAALYAPESDRLFIVAVMHLRWRPC